MNWDWREFLFFLKLHFKEQINNNKNHGPRYKMLQKAHKSPAEDRSPNNHTFMLIMDW